MNFIPGLDRLLNNILPTLDETSNIGRLIHGLIQHLNFMMNNYHRAESEIQRLETEVQNLNFENEVYLRLTTEQKQTNDRLNADNERLLDDKLRLRDENSRLFEENSRLRAENVKIQEENDKLHQGFPITSRKRTYSF